MGNRLSAIATRTGDGGTTGLGDGSRVSKSDPRVTAMGDVDELNSSIGMLIALGVPVEELRMGQLLADVQARPARPRWRAEHSRLHAAQGRARRRTGHVAHRTAKATLPRLQEFIRPGGTLAAAQAHVCRTVCRRAEHAVVELAESQAVSNTVRQYLNRLSDLMFVMARVLNRSGGGYEHQWDRTRNH